MDTKTYSNRWIGAIIKFSLFIGVYLFLTVTANKGIYWVALLGSMIILVLFFINMEKGVLVFIVFMLMSPWTSRMDIRSTVGLASIHTIYIKGFNLFTYLLIFLSIIILVKYLQKAGKLKFTLFEKAFFFVIATYILSAFVGVNNFFIYPRQYVADIAPLINMISAFLMVRLVFRDTSQINRLITVLMYTFTAMAFMVLVWFVAGSGYSKGVLLMPIYDPIGGFPVFLISLSIAMIALSKKAITKNIGYFLVLFIGFAFFLLWPSRAQLIVFVCSLFFIATILSRKEFCLYSGLIAVTAISLFAILNAVVPKILAYSMWKISTLKYIVLALDAPGTISQRLIEGYNILLRLWDSGSILWGNGAGSWFDDNYRNFPFIFENEEMALTAFSEDQLFYWKFFRPHDTFLFVLLKAGMIGLFGYLYFILVFIRHVRFEILRSKYTYRSIILAGVAVPFLSQFLGFSAKNYVMAGILFGIVVNVVLDSKSLYHRVDGKTI